MEQKKGNIHTKKCFVVMGFGKHMDYQNAKMVDLDIIYHKVIEKMFSKSFQDYELIRADEVPGSSLIELSMYELLMAADLVIADITTLNANAIYELGIRHALRPSSTIIMMQDGENSKIPFDLSHVRIFKYKDYEDKLDKKEAKKIRKKLKTFIKDGKGYIPDSPLYTLLHDLQPPRLTALGRKNMEGLVKKEEKIADQVQCAQKLMRDERFQNAAEVWEKLHKLRREDDYIVQQWALSRYKSKFPNETQALEEALDIIKTLNPDKSLNLETLGITGAIYKRLYALHQNTDYLNKAIKYYGKGYHIKDDYYNGENYAFCVLKRAKFAEIQEENREHLRYVCKLVFRNIIDTQEKKIQDDNEGDIDYWVYATLATCQYYVGNMEQYEKYEKMFLENAASDWEKKTHWEQLDELKTLMY